MPSLPNFTNGPRQTVTQISTANTNRDGTGTIATAFTAGTFGSRIDTVRITATGTTTAGVVRLFIHDGTNARLLKEQLVDAITPSTTVEVFNATITYSDGLLLPAPGGSTAYSLRASTNNAETFNVFVQGGDF